MGQDLCGTPAATGGQHAPVTSSIIRVRGYTHVTYQSALKICNLALNVWNFSMIGYVLTNARQFESPYPTEFHLANIQNFSKIVWKCTLNLHAGKIHLETNNSVQLCLGDTPKTKNWWDTRQKCHNWGVGQECIWVLRWQYLWLKSIWTSNPT